MGKTALMNASMYGKTSIVKRLIENGAKLNSIEKTVGTTVAVAEWVARQIVQL